MDQSTVPEVQTEVAKTCDVSLYEREREKSPNNEPWSRPCSGQYACPCHPGPRLSPGGFSRDSSSLQRQPAAGRHAMSGTDGAATRCSPSLPAGQEQGPGPRRPVAGPGTVRSALGRGNHIMHSIPWEIPRMSGEVMSVIGIGSGRARCCRPSTGLAAYLAQVASPGGNGLEIMCFT